MKPCKASYIASFILEENNTSEKDSPLTKLNFFLRTCLFKLEHFIYNYKSDQDLMH